MSNFYNRRVLLLKQMIIAQTTAPLYVIDAFGCKVSPIETLEKESNCSISRATPPNINDKNSEDVFTVQLKTEADREMKMSQYTFDQNDETKRLALDRCDEIKISEPYYA